MDGVNQQRCRSAAAEDDGVDHIGVDSPRSGVATPQPDLHDRRLPGIMSYFNQVRASSLQRFLSSSFRMNGQPAATDPGPAMPSIEEHMQAAATVEPPLTPPVEPDSAAGSPEQGPSPLTHEMLEIAAPETSAQENSRLHTYPTPPASQPCSLRNFAGDSCGSQSRGASPPASRTTSLRHMSFSDFGRGKARRSSLLAPLTATVDDSTVSARHLSNPAGSASVLPSSSLRAHLAPGAGDDVSYESASVVDLRKKLTDVSAKKSGASTPTRALSSTHPSQDDVKHRNGDKIDRTATSTPTPPGAQAPAARGKLTIKISEARGLRKCRDPYVVVVFQRSELISSGPHAVQVDDDDAAVAAVAHGGIPIQRQGSDSGRPMAIPMRSRQSSNTSLSEFNTFRNRNPRRSFTNPKWDAEAIL